MTRCATFKEQDVPFQRLSFYRIAKVEINLMLICAAIFNINYQQFEAVNLLPFILLLTTAATRAATVLTLILDFVAICYAHTSKYTRIKITICSKRFAAFRLTGRPVFAFVISISLQMMLKIE